MATVRKDEAANHPRHPAGPFFSVFQLERGKKYLAKFMCILMLVFLSLHYILVCLLMTALIGASY